MRQILKVIVGSQAHGLATPESDFDYRGVFVVPTSEILSLGGHKTNTSWIEGRDDDTSWEIGHFLNLATHCNPTILETFLAPRADKVLTDDVSDSFVYEYVLLNNKAYDFGTELRALFPHIWNSTDVMNAFVGYSHNQKKKMLDDKDGRRSKYAAAYLRVLYNAWELLSTGTFTIRIADTPVGETVRRFKEGKFTNGEAIDICDGWQKFIEDVYAKSDKKETNMDEVNKFLLKVRKEYWT